MHERKAYQESHIRGVVGCTGGTDLSNWVILNHTLEAAVNSHVPRGSQHISHHLSALQQVEGMYSGVLMRSDIVVDVCHTTSAAEGRKR